MKGRKLFPRIIIALVILTAGYVVLIGDYSLIKVGSLYLEKEKLRSDLESMETERGHLIEESQKIRKEKEELERLAREKLGMVRPGERLYKAIVIDKPIETVREPDEGPGIGARQSEEEENAQVGRRKKRSAVE